jgi:ATP-binding cassette, subfamily B, multidrug efflux pump
VEEEVLGKAYDGRLMRRLLTYVRPYRPWVALSLFFLLINAILQIAGPLLTKYAIDKYLLPALDPNAPEASAGWLDPWLSTEPWTGISQISMLYLAALLGAFIFEFAQIYVMQWSGQHAMFDLRRQIMAHLQKLDVSYFDRNPVGRLVTRVTTDVDVLNELFTSGLVTILGDLLMLLFIVFVMFQMSPGLTLVMLAVLPFVLAVTTVFRRTVSASYRRIRVAIAKINAYLQEHVNGITVLQLFNRERKSRDEFARINADHMEAFKDSVIAYGWFYPVVEFLSMLALAGMLVYGGYRVEQGALSLGVLVAFLQYSVRFFRPIQDLSEKYNILQGAMAASERIFKLIDTPVEVLEPAAPKTLHNEPLDIEFDHVWFAYKNEDWVLRDVSFRIAPGETIAVVGHTGAGKTTLTNLLLRFYDVQRGHVRIGGIDVRDLPLHELRDAFSIVLQDPYLFTGTLGGNIRLGTEGISQKQIEEAVERVNLRDFVQKLPQGYDQPVRERGAGYSTGQKQLISFARALAHDPRILILDEATSSVDTETEIRVREALGRLVEGRTSIIIAHRLSTIQQADRIFVMHKGQLREVGTHQELLALRGIYYKLYQLQYKDQELATSRKPNAAAD